MIEDLGIDLQRGRVDSTRREEIELARSWADMTKVMRFKRMYM